MATDYTSEDTRVPIEHQFNPYSGMFCCPNDLIHL